MTTNNLTIAIETAKSPNAVFNCLADVNKWWTEDFEGSSSRLGDEFIIHHLGQHYSKQKLIEVIPNKKIVWLVTDSTLYWLQKDKHEWTNTKMTFEIMAKGDKTILHFTHEGLNPEKECFAMCERGWTMIIGSWLLHFITNGTASPEMTKAAEIRNKILADHSKSPTVN